MDLARGVRRGAIAWCVAAVFAGLSLWLWMRPAPDLDGAVVTPSDKRGTGSTAAAECPACQTQAPSCPPADLAPLRSCLSRLEAARARLKHENRARTRSVHPPDAGRSTNLRVEELVQERLQERLEEIVAAQRATRDEEREARWASAMSLVENELELSGEESVWISEFVCAVREVRGATLSDLADRGEPAGPDTWRQIREDRDNELVNLKSFLGPERYARFREIGGIGLLNDTLDCDRGR